ncbi:MAG: hypothetical protein QF732_06420, partial [Nitrospinaceae bacterium]|nr:hypothetical protein [Nitrospinaceae bacterium]
MSKLERPFHLPPTALTQQIPLYFSGCIDKMTPSTLSDKTMPKENPKPPKIEDLSYIRKWIKRCLSKDGKT